MKTRNWPPDAETIPVDEFGLPTLRRSDWRCWHVTLVRKFGPVEYTHVYAESRQAAQAKAIDTVGAQSVLYTSAAPATLAEADAQAEADEIEWARQECDKAALQYVGCAMGGVVLMSFVVLTGVYADDIVRVLAGWMS